MDNFLYKSIKLKFMFMTLKKIISNKININFQII